MWLRTAVATEVATTTGVALDAAEDADVAPNMCAAELADIYGFTDLATTGCLASGVVSQTRCVVLFMESVRFSSENGMAEESDVAPGCGTAVDSESTTTIGVALDAAPNMCAAECSDMAGFTDLAKAERATLDAVEVAEAAPKLCAAELSDTDVFTDLAKTGCARSGDAAQTRCVANFDVAQSFSENGVAEDFNVAPECGMAGASEKATTIGVVLDAAEDTDAAPNNCGRGGQTHCAAENADMAGFTDLATAECVAPKLGPENGMADDINVAPECDVAAEPDGVATTIGAELDAENIGAAPK